LLSINKARTLVITWCINWAEPNLPLGREYLAYATHGDKQAKHDQGKESVMVARSV